MKQWFVQLEQRERRLLSFGIAAVLVIALAGLVWMPLAERRAALAEQVAAQRNTLSWMREARARILDARRSGESTASKAGGSLLSVVDAGVRQRGFADNLRRAEPDGDKRVRIWLAGVKFDELAGWLESLDARRGVRVADMTVTRGEAGRVDARVTLAGG